MTARLVAVAVGTFIACQATAPDVGLGGGAPLSSVSYRLSWDTTGVELDDAGGFSLTTDLGYEVRVERGYLVTYVVQLDPCDEAESDGLAGLLGLRSAAAYHGEDVDASVAGNIVESLASPGTVELGTIEFESATYCSVHYLVAATDGNTSRLPDDVGMEATSLYLEGTYAAPGTSAPVPFALRATQATAILQELDDVTNEYDPDVRHADVEVVRSLSTLFDQIAFESVDADELEYAILANLRYGAYAAVRISD